MPQRRHNLWLIFKTVNLIWKLIKIIMYPPLNFEIHLALYFKDKFTINSYVGIIIQLSVEYELKCPNNKSSYSIVGYTHWKLSHKPRLFSTWRLFRLCPFHFVACSVKRSLYVYKSYSWRTTPFVLTMQKVQHKQ